MNQAVNYVEENLSGRVNLEIAAQLAQCTVWEFQRLFSFITHISFGEYVRGRKLSLAANDIKNGNEKIVDISLKYGYDSPAAFSRAFKRQYGVSPSDFHNGSADITPYPKIDFQTFDQERDVRMKTANNIQAYSDRGYYVKENAPVYYSCDIEKTCSWFRDVLGWFGGVVGKDDDGIGIYGCVFDYPSELIVSRLTPFRGIHIFKGEPTKSVIGFIMIQNLDIFYDYVLKNGWQQITKIEATPWGTKECQVTTIDGCIIRFFESEE
jgi:AraC family transcriptional regulator